MAAKKPLREVIVPPNYNLPTPNDVWAKAAGLWGYGKTKIPPPKHGPDRYDPNVAAYDDFARTYDRYLTYMMMPTDRIGLYNLYEDIAEVAEIGSVLDGYAEDATQFDQKQQRTVWCEAEDNRIIEETHAMFDRIGLEEWIEGLAHDIAQNGDDFGRVYYDEDAPQKGVLGLEWFDPREVERVEDPYGNLIGFARVMDQERLSIKKDVDEVDLWMPWDVIHWRLLSKKFMRFRNGDDRYGETALYGTSLLWNVRRTGKQVRLLEELLLIYRLTKAVDRFIYYIDVGVGTSPAEKTRKLDEWRRALKKREFKNPTTGEFDVLYHAAALDDDIWWPIQGDLSNSRIEVRPAAGNVTDAVDYDAFINKMFAGLRAPKAYFGYEGDVDARATLSNQDVRFARGVKKIQRAVITGLTRLAELNLILRFNLEPEDVQGQVTLRMVEPSQLEHIQRLEADQIILDVAQRYLDFGQGAKLSDVPWTIWILQNIIRMADDDIQRMMQGKEGAEDALGDVGISGPPPVPLANIAGAGGGDLGLPDELEEPVAGEEELPPAPEGEEGEEQQSYRAGRRLIAELTDKMTSAPKLEMANREEYLVATTDKLGREKRSGEIRERLSERRDAQGHVRLKKTLEKLSQQYQDEAISKKRYREEVQEAIRQHMVSRLKRPSVDEKKKARKSAGEIADELMKAVESTGQSRTKLRAVFKSFRITQDG